MNYEYQVGGSLPPNAPSYVCRHADNDLYQSLKNGDFCYVLNSRQMGKSSLRVRTMQRLQQEGIACAAIDVTAIGNEGVTPDRWYAGILYELESNFNLSSNFRTWWREREMLSPIQRLSEFIEQVLLTEKTQKIVIFIDEIDSVLSLNFPLDDFFAFIRACYNKRADNFHYQRLTFGLFGVATPADLIQDKTRTPFNIGKAIELQGFQLSETQPLAEGLKNKAARPVEVLKAILAWTNGQPFLTQKLCKIILSSSGFIAAGTEIKIIKKLVKLQILDNWESLDNPEHLKTIRDRILRRGERASRLLGIYQEVLQEKEIIADNSVEQGELCLSGLVVKTGGKIKVYNAIYRAVFNASWVEQELANMRPYAESMTAWLASNCQDESRLLRGQALEAAQAWATGKSLSDRDYQFLAASQELDKREVKKALAAEKEANQLLSTAQQKAQKRIRIGGIILAASLVSATLMTIWSGSAVKNANSRLKTAQDATRLEREGMSVLQQFEAGNEQLPVLVSAMKTAQDLQKMVDSTVPVSEYPTTTPLLALQKILDKITQRNQFHEISEDDIKFSPDGNLVAIKQINYLANKKQDDVVRILDNQGRQLFQVQEIPGDWEFSPDSQLIAISGQKGTVGVWNKTGEEILKLPGNGNLIVLKFSPTGKQLLTFYLDGKVNFLWDLLGKKFVEIQADPNNYGRIYSSDLFSPDGQKFVTVTTNGTFNLWNLTGQKITEVKAHQNGIRSVKFSPDGQRFITEASAETTAKIWDISGRLIAELKGHNYAVTRIRVSSNGQRLITTDVANRIRLWDWSGQLIATLDNPGEIASINFSPDGNLLIVATSQKVRLFDVAGKLIVDLKGVGNSVNFSPDGKLLVVATSEKVRLFDVAGNLKGVGNSVQFSPNGQLIAISGGDGTASLWNLSGQQLAQFKGHFGSVKISFSPDEKQVVTVGLEGKVRIWNLSGKLLAELTWGQKLFANNEDYVAKVLKFSPDGKNLMTLGHDKILWFWDLSNQKLTGDEWVQDYDYQFLSADGKYLITYDDKTVRVWNLSGKKLVEIKQQEAIRRVSFSANKNILVTQSERIVRLWDLSGKLLTELKHDNKIWEIQFSPNEQILATYGDAIVTLWDLSGKQLAKFQAIECVDNCLQFSADGQKLIIRSDFPFWEEIRFQTWDLSGNLIAEIKEGSLAAISPNTQQVVALETDGIIKLWDLSGKQLSQFKVSLNAKDKVVQLKFSPDGTRLLTVVGEKNRLTIGGEKTYLWDLSGKQLAAINGKIAIPSGFYIDPENYLNEQWFVTVEKPNSLNPSNYNIHTWDWSGQQISQFKVSDYNEFVAMSQNGKMLATQSINNSIQIWDSSSQKLGELSKYQTGEILEFSPDSQFLITKDQEIIRFWDFSGRQFAEWNNAINSQDDWRYIAVNENGKLRMLPVSHNLEELLARGCDWLKYYLETHPDEAKQLKVCQIQ
jgi:WD40 repeat protein